MYCELPKVGSSNWKRVLIKLTDDRFKDIRNVLAIRKPRKLEHYNLRYITDYPWQQRIEMLKTYYKFIIVRDPIERILSAYRDKGTVFSKFIFSINAKKLGVRRTSLTLISFARITYSSLAQRLTLSSSKNVLTFRHKC